MAILVTGGCGFIGSHITTLLVNKGYETIILDNLSTGFLENIGQHTCPLYINDLNDSNLEEIFLNHSIEVIIHQAAQASVAHSISDFVMDEAINISGTLKLINLAKKYGVKKIIFASSSAVYGTPQFLPITTEHLSNPLSPYGLSKLTAEKYLQLSHHLFGLQFTILRYGNVYGPRQNASTEGGVAAIFSEALLKGESPIIYGTGEQTRDFVFVEDVAEANIQAITQGDGKVLNVSTGKETTVYELFQSIKTILLSEASPIYYPARLGDIQRSVLCNNEIKRVLNWEPHTSLEDGLKKTVEFFQKKSLR